MQKEQMIQECVLLLAQCYQQVARAHHLPCRISVEPRKTTEEDLRATQGLMKERLYR